MTSVVDTVFAGHLGATSVNALTAMGLLSPVLSIFTAFQALYAVSTAILIARHLNNKERRNGYFSTGILFTILVSLTVSILSFWGLDNMLHWLGAEREVCDLAKRYLQIQLVSNIFSAMGYTLTSCIRALGYPKMEMVITTLAVGVNIAANAIFAFGFQMGFTGLALGTLVSEIICMLLAVCWLLKKGFFPSFRPLHCTTLCCRAWELFRLGFVQTVIQALAGCTGFFVNNSLMLHATLNHVAIWNIVQKIYILLLMPIVGITQGIQTIIAYYSGDKQETKKQKTIRLTIFYTVLYGCIGTVLVFLFGNRILSIFGSSDAILAQSKAVLEIIFLTFPVVGIFYTILTLLEVTGHDPNLFPQLKNAVFWAVPISDLLILFLAIIMKAIALENSKECFQVPDYCETELINKNFLQMKLFIPLYTSNKRIAAKAAIIKQRAQNGVSMKMKANTYTKKKQIVEEKLIENYAKYYKLAYSYVRNESDAQDIVQEGAYKAILNCNSLKNDSYADTWIYRIMINEAITHFRGKKKETVSMDNLLETETITDSYQDIDLYHAIDALETLDRTILILRYFEELKLEQIARITQQNLNTVKTRLYRTLKKLRLTFLSNEDI